nr:unnamed protein product [Spirometra erinaceieuropaei]
MKWFAGKLSDCIKDVKVNRRLLFVFSKPESSSSSNTVLETLEHALSEEICKDVICLLLTVGTEGYEQFTAIYSAQSLPCIHLILPSGEILGVKTSDFAPEQLSSWLKEHVEKFVAWKAPTEPASAPSAGVTTAAVAVTSNVDLAPSADGSNVAISSADASTSSDSRTTSAAESTGVPASIVGDTTSSSDRIERARQLLREKRDRELEEAFERKRQAELDRRRLGKQMVEFKERQREQDIKEQLEARKREQAEDKAARERILRQIELDRRERAQRLLDVPLEPDATPTVAPPQPSSSYASDRTKVSQLTSVFSDHFWEVRDMTACHI